MSQPTRLALILGASGGIGGETAAALARDGWRIRAFSRGGKPLGGAPAWEWVQGDALDRASVTAAAEGASVILHAVNPPGYKNWAGVVLPMIENTIHAAQSSGARILLPGTIYNYGPDAFPVLREDSPQHASARKGRIRIALEQKLEAAAAQGAPSLIVRFGDFFGPRPGGSWFSQGMVKPNRPVTTITYPGEKGVGHSWAYLPDAAETFAHLLRREPELPAFARFHFRGHWDPDGTAMIAAIAHAAGNPSLPVKALPWFALKLASPFNETLRELSAIRPLWQTPIELDNTRLVQFLGSEPHTPLDAAVQTTLQNLGCLA